MMTHKDLLVHSQRQRDLQREAERQRLANSMRKRTRWEPGRAPRAFSRLVALFL